MVKSDPILFQVITNALNGILQEMTKTLQYSAWSYTIASIKDFSCSLFDRDIRQIAQYDALPIHTNSLHLHVRAMSEYYGENIHDGDIIFSNDPYYNCTHIGDVTVAAPMFHNGELIAWFANRAHYADMGERVVSCSIDPTATNVWQEGFHCPPIKIYEKRKERKDIINVILSQLRNPDEKYGDIMAQAGCVNIGKKKLRELIERRGFNTVMFYVEQLLDYADRRMSNEIKSWPKGNYVGRSWVDSDGQGTVNIPVKVNVTIGDDKILIDFTESAPQVKGCTNATLGALNAASGSAVLCCISPDIPHNASCIKYLEVKSKKGTLCNAEYPAATALATINPSDILQDSIFRALLPAIPDRVTAGIAKANSEYVISGTMLKNKKIFSILPLNACGGGGANKKFDGWPLIITPASMGAMTIESIEMTELLYPFVIEKCEIETDSMGMGKTIGGPGIRMKLRITEESTPCDIAIIADGHANPPYGAYGGTPGIGGGFHKVDSKGKRTFYTGKGTFVLNHGETLVTVSTGGGGYGSPLERDPELVRQSVRDELVSSKAAKKIFGVVIDPVSLTIDYDETRKLRNKLKKSETIKVVVPDEPGASTWIKENVKEGEDVCFLEGGH